MKLNCSRRQGLKILTSLPLIHYVPAALATGRHAEQAEAVVLLSKVNPASQTFAEKASNLLDAVLLEINLQQTASFSSLNTLPENTLIIGLISEAEKILVDSFIQNRRGYLQTCGYLHAEDSDESSIDSLLVASIQHGIDRGGASQAATSEAGTLSSIYARI